MSFFEFPNTNYYQPDLGWLIKHVKALDAQVSNLQELVDKLNELYETIPDEIQAAVDAAMAQIRTEMDEYKAKVDATLAQINQSQSDMYAQLVKLQSAVLSINNLITQTLESAKAYADFQDNVLYLKIMNYLETWDKEWPLVLCPVDNQREPIDTALRHIWNGSAAGGVTVQDLIDWKVTVNDLIKYGITVNELIYRSWQVWATFYIPGMFKMLDPFTGMMSDIRTVIYELAEFHMHGWRVNDLIQQGITVNDLINENVTAYELAYGRKIAGKYPAQYNTGMVTIATGDVVYNI